MRHLKTACGAEMILDNLAPAQTVADSVRQERLTSQESVLRGAVDFSMTETLTSVAVDTKFSAVLTRIMLRLPKAAPRQNGKCQICS
jgi:hypothetical protein